MKKFLSDKWNIVIVIVVAVMIAEFGFIASRPHPCIVSLDYYPNLPDHGNFGQPILTKHDCQQGQIPTNIRDYLPKDMR